ncbi:hypothetical protein B0H13DRAFT_2456801 [Mycena leptocephala]|nr:hypothetical protein B0H13DRAFT_2456801 [Mycena leptocephala]
MNTSSIPGASSSFSALPMDTPTRYVPKSFRYNTPLNNNTFGAVKTPLQFSFVAYLELPSPLDPRYQSSRQISLRHLSGNLRIRRPERAQRLGELVGASVPHLQVLARASSAPPIPSPCKSTPSLATPLAEDDDDDEQEEFEFQYGRSSSLPPEALSNTPPTPSPMVIVQTCPGSALDWPVDVGPFMEMFPFHRIGMQPGSLSFNVEIHDRGTKVYQDKLVNLAVQADSRVNHHYLSWSHIQALLADCTEEVRRWRLKSLNVARNFATAVRKLADYKHFMDAVAEMNIPRLQQLSALEGVYRPRPVLDSRTLDIVLMVYRLGGRKLLYANHANCGMISVSDIIHNIREVMLKPREAAAVPQLLRGVSFMIDEVALEERANHFHHNNSISGLCWRHSAKINLQLKTYDDAMKISDKIKAEEVHLGKEMTVVSVSCFGELGTYPILALPTCKFVGPTESSLIYETVTNAWLEHAADKVGMPWSWATDGESSRRRAGYDQFVKDKLPSMSPIFGTLAGMASLNIFTGLHSITLDFDYKHIFKNQSDESVRKILFPDDPQDVPHAVELMESIIEILSCDFGQAEADAAADLDSIRLLALLLKSILAPFITPTMSLSEQMTHLSTYAHLTFTLFRLNRLTFMSNQLYGDSQSMIKNAFFCLAKQQQLDPTKPFYLFQVGDDPLERLFGKLRMLGGHNSAMSYAQGIERLGHACDLQAVYLRQPDLDQGQRRISMNRAEGVDHLNMVSWTGHAIAGDCHTASVWDEVLKSRKQIFKKLRFPLHSYDYAAIFSDLEIDMLRPFGDGKYPGVESDVDRSTITTPTISSATPPSSFPSASTPTPASSGPVIRPPHSEQHTYSISCLNSLALLNPNSSTAPGPSSSSSRNPRSPNNDDDLEDESADGIPFEATLDDIPELALPSGRGVDPNDYLDVDGKWVHKQRICRVVINADFEPKSTERLKRVRGHTKVNGKKRDDVNPEAILGANTFIIGDPFFTLLRTDQTLSLAVVRSTAILEDGISRGSILAPTIRNPMAKVKLSGQVLSMTMIPTLDDKLPESVSALARPRPSLPEATRSPDSMTEDQSPWSWIWNGRFLKVDSAIAGTKQTTEKVVIVSVPGALTDLVNYRPVDALPRLGERAYDINSERRSWELDDGPMGAVCELLWDAVAQKIPLISIVTVKKSSEFPYVFDNGKPALVCHAGTQLLIQEHDNKVERACHFCGDRGVNWRAHIGTHILRFIRGVNETLRTPLVSSSHPAQIGPILPCGFCAASGKPECQVNLRKKAQVMHVECECPMRSAFNYKPADQGSKTTPCRNVPIVCKLCHPDAPRAASQPAQWRYNMPEHLNIAHLEYASPLNPGGTRLPHEVWVSMEVNAKEEMALGILPTSIPAAFEDIAGPDEGLDRVNMAAGRKRKAKSSVSGPAQRRKLGA